MNLVTWNTQWCCGLDGVVSPQRIVDTARELADFDVLCLQEIASNYPRARGDASHDQPALIAQLLGAGFQVFFGAAVDEFTGEGRQRFGNLVATRLPVAQPEEIALRMRDELETLARLSGGIAHDFNNLLTIILGNAELVEESLPPQSDLLPMVEAIRSTAERIRSSVIR